MTHTRRKQLDSAELATVLAALRFYQAKGQGEPDNRSEAIHDVATDGGNQISLNAEAIDQLCEELNVVQPANETPAQRELLAECLSAFDDEEDSVKQEHAALIARVRSALNEAEAIDRLCERLNVAEPTNEIRAQRGRNVMDAYLLETGDGQRDEGHLADLLVDLMHMTAADIDAWPTFEAALATARMNFEFEREEGDQS